MYPLNISGNRAIVSSINREVERNLSSHKYYSGVPNPWHIHVATTGDEAAVSLLSEEVEDVDQALSLIGGLAYILELCVSKGATIVDGLLFTFVVNPAYGSGEVPWTCSLNVTTEGVYRIVTLTMDGVTDEMIFQYEGAPDVDLTKTRGCTARTIRNASDVL